MSNNIKNISKLTANYKIRMPEIFLSLEAFRIIHFSEKLFPYRNRKKKQKTDTNSLASKSFVV